MKQFARFWVLAAVAISAFGATLFAQDEAAVPEDLAGFYAIQTTGGTLVAGEGDAYTLTLEGVGEILPWVINTPYLYSGEAETNLFVLDWAAADALSGVASLRAGEDFVELALTAPAFDLTTGTLTFNATVSYLEAPNADPKAGAPTPPAEFEATTVFVRLDAAFESGVAAGSDLRAEGTRVDRNEDASSRGGAGRVPRDRGG
ncbi:MAG: hypothetical protein ACOYL5_01625 [Phototrophicaceae bacterium]